MTSHEQSGVNAPETEPARMEIYHRGFISQGAMIAFPLCFPGASTPIPHDESFISALDVAPDGMVYGATGGRRVHLFVGMFHGVTGAVFDMGVVEAADECVAVCCGKKMLIAFVNGPEGGRTLRCRFRPLPYQLLQEWDFSRYEIEDLGQPAPGEKIIHACRGQDRKTAFVATENHLVAVDFETAEMKTLGAVEARGQLVCSPKGNLYGLDGVGHLWRLDAATGSLTHGAVALPDGSWGNASPRWARGAPDSILYVTDDDGRLFAFDEETGFGPPCAKLPLLPVGPMAVTHDGRVFGFCGGEISRMFSYDPATGKTTDLGVAVSFFERRRYGYVFADAVTGRDGRIFFGESDNLGHLWIYFPAILPKAE
jgi:hypothetical protein